MPADPSVPATRVEEIVDGIYRIHTPVEIPGGGAFSFNQYLVVDDEPMLYHTGPRTLFPLIRDAVSRVLPPAELRWIGFSHFEADECGALNEWLALAPRAQAVCSSVGAMTSVSDIADRAPRALADGETFSIGRRTLRWFETPHLPHGWDCGHLFDETTRTLFCGDLFTQPGGDAPALTRGDILAPSEAFRQVMDYFAHAPNTGAMLDRLAAASPTTLACMHGSAWAGDGAVLLRSLAASLSRS